MPRRKWTERSGAQAMLRNLQHSVKKLCMTLRWIAKSKAFKRLPDKRDRRLRNNVQNALRDSINTMDLRPSAK